MAEKQTSFFERCSFLTQARLKGWEEDGRPIWGKLIAYDESRWPHWDDWNDTKNTYIAPLCGAANSVTIFGNEWLSEKGEVLELRNFVEAHFVKRGRHLVCDRPTELVDAPLFWTGGSGRHFILFQVISFNLDRLPFVLDCLRHHTQAGTMSPRYGPPFTSIYNFAKSVVKEGKFAVIFTGGEAELYYPTEYKDQVEGAIRDVEERQRNESQMVRERNQQKK